MNQIPSFRDFEQFYLSYCVGAWSNALVRLPYGDFLTLHPNDDASMLYAGNLEIEKSEKIVDEIEGLADFWKRPVGFYISPSWTGDVEGFKGYLLTRGYHESHRMIPHILDEASAVDSIKESAFKVSVSNDFELIRDIFGEVFGVPKSMSDLVVRGLENNSYYEHESQFFIAHDGDQPVGIAGCHYNGNYGYMNCLCVRKEFRQKKCASHLVKERLKFLRAKGVKYIVTNVVDGNTPSLNTQKKIGYSKWCEVSVWTKKDSKYTKEI